MAQVATFQQPGEFLRAQIWEDLFMFEMDVSVCALHGFIRILFFYLCRVFRDLLVHSLCSFVHVPTASLLYKLHFLTDCHETSHTCSQTSSLVRVRTWASQITCNLPNRGLLPL